MVMVCAGINANGAHICEFIDERAAPPNQHIQSITNINNNNNSTVQQMQPRSLFMQDGAVQTTQQHNNTLPRSPSIL